ncbi:histone-lysine N-methyltransferase SETD1B isoform X3 [Drosophila guanche]|uniref:histone-lysine N-methyltransferase SETD1B isoform X3 n=1 Tax=Drosophila guanche TaxID=7266 RepID=UPI0014723CDB|nr:histone-lysine N-methyltransferase SETD1B isoform X3 [Drosophila guanche]
MVRAIYLTLAALLALACAVSAAPARVDTSLEFPSSRQVEEEEPVHNSSADSSEEHDDDDDVEDDDDDDDDSLIRRRREADTTEEIATETPSELEKEPVAVTAAVPVVPSRKPVLVLIRDALKKVTSDLPTAQVANNALQYFQQFEHFIQQTIEQAIGDDYDDDDETPATAIPSTDETKQPEAESTQQPEKEVETAAASEPEPGKPVEEPATPLSNAV